MDDLLAITLDVAVPIAIEEVRSWTPEERVTYARTHADDIASHGDDLMFGGRKGEAARLFAILARCFACMAYQPGGVRFADRRWEAS